LAANIKTRSSVETPLVLEPIAPSIGATALYEQDFCLWTQTMVAALRSGDFTHLDLENLAEEVESLGRRDRRELRNEDLIRSIICGLGILPGIKQPRRLFHII
jgi:hypothetical protein